MTTDSYTKDPNDIVKIRFFLLALVMITDRRIFGELLTSSLNLIEKNPTHFLSKSVSR